MIKIGCDLTTVKYTKDVRRWLQKFALPEQNFTKMLKPQVHAVVTASYYYYLCFLCSEFPVRLESPWIQQGRNFIMKLQKLWQKICGRNCGYLCFQDYYIYDCPCCIQNAHTSLLLLWGLTSRGHTKIIVRIFFSLNDPLLKILSCETEAAIKHPFKFLWNLWDWTYLMQNHADCHYWLDGQTLWR